MQSMAQQNDGLSDDNVHVRELKRLFNSCNVDRNGLLNREGLLLLSEKLNLGDFSDSIVERVLCSDNSITFKQFKDRFLSFLPEIIDLASGNQDELLLSAYKSCSSLDIKDTQRLSRYDVHAVCEATSELDLLSILDINLIFDKISIAGRVSLVDFIAQYRAKQKMSDEIHFIADSYRISTVNLFESLDVNNTGEADNSTVIEYFTNCGLKLEEAISLLKEFNHSTSPTVNLVNFGNYLEAALSQILTSFPTSARAAVFCMKSLIENHRCTVREFELRCEHMQKQIHIANQRRTMLIEELDQNQQSIEASYNSRLREMEERCRSRLAAMEEKFRIERSEMQKEIETIEKDLSLVRHNETSLKNKVQLVERHNKRISLELEEQTENVNGLEKENQELRAQLRKKQQFRPSEDNAKVMAWKQKVELMVAHNKRLREKLREVTKHSKYDKIECQSFVQWTAPFRSQLLLIRKRRSQKGDTLSEMDSEPESIFYRRRRKRLKKRRDRMRRYEVIHNLNAGTTNEADDVANNFNETGNNSLLSPRSRDMLLNLKDSDNSASSDRKLIARAKISKKSSNAFEELAHVNEYEVEIKTLQNTMAAQKQMYEGQITNLSRKVTALQNTQNSEQSSRFYSLFEKYRKQDNIDQKLSISLLGVEKNGIRNRVSPSLCSKCPVIEPKINELYVLVGGSSSNLTVEDPVPTTSNQDKTYLQIEIGRLRTRLNLARGKVSEIQSIMSLPNSTTRLGTNIPQLTKTSSYSTRAHRSFADFRERAPHSERVETPKDSVADPSQFSQHQNASSFTQKYLHN